MAHRNLSCLGAPIGCGFQSETSYIFAYCGLVVEIPTQLLKCVFFASPPTSTKRHWTPSEGFWGLKTRLFEGHKSNCVPFWTGDLGLDLAVGQNHFGIPCWLVGGLGCSQGVRDFHPWPFLWRTKHVRSPFLGGQRQPSRQREERDRDRHPDKETWTADRRTRQAPPSQMCSNTNANWKVVTRLCPCITAIKGEPLGPYPLLFNPKIQRTSCGRLKEISVSGGLQSCK